MDQVTPALEFFWGNLFLRLSPSDFNSVSQLWDPGLYILRSTTDCAHSSLRTTKTVLPQAVVEKGGVCMWGGQPVCQWSSQILAMALLLWEVGAPSLQTTLCISVLTSLT